MYSQYSSQGGGGGALDEEAALGILKYMNTEELQNLLNHENKMDEIINDVQQVKNMQREKETLMTSNKSVADYNLSQEPRLQRARQQLSSIYERAVADQKSFDQHKQALSYADNHQSLDTSFALLQTESAKSEEASEEMADDFLDGKIEMENFLEDYIPKRTVAHQRRVKVEKMKEILQNRNRGTGGSTAPTNNFYSYQNNMGGMAMPNSTSYLPQ